MLRNDTILYLLADRFAVFFSIHLAVPGDLLYIGNDVMQNPRFVVRQGGG